MRYLLLLLLLVAAPVSAQTLTLGEAVPGSLTAESKDTYTFETSEDYYVYGYVDQISVDVVVRILDPEGEEVGEYDSPARGPEPFQFSPETSGTFTIEVTPFEGEEGDYSVLLVANEPKATEPTALVDQLMQPFSSNDAPGAVISVVRNGDVVLAKGFGMANLTYGIPMTAETGVSIASVSKHFTGMALVLLEQDGALSLDDDVRDHLPDLKDFGTPITLRMMLNHTTGYREVLNFLPMAGWQFTDAMDRDLLTRIVQNQPQLQNDPGSEYNYNNTTFMLLADVVEKASEMEFGEFMQERIFKPLGMTNSTIKTHQGQVIPGSGQGYVAASGGGYRYVTDFAGAYGASGVNTTAHDIVKWMGNFRDHTVGGPEAIDSLTERGILTSGDTTNYALGLGVREWRGQMLYTHTGGETSFRTWFGYFPDIDSGLFFSSNHPSFSLGMWTDLAEAFFGEYLEAEEEEEEETTVEAGSVPTAEQLEAISGMWRFIGAPLMIEYTVEDGELFAQATNQPKFKVEPTSDSTFTFVGVPASVTFHFEEDGTTTRATHHQGPDSPMEKVVAPDMTEEELAAFTGRFINDELETIYTLTIEEGELKGHHRRLDSFTVTHLVDDEFTAGAWFLGGLKFQRDPTGKVIGFLAGSGRTRDVWFRRME
ncbi:MAG: beta-lactamase family protein [Rhodothermales bacterium]|nr:beta-lactamase family protein [Rhodothermales bacterium]MBO6778621.1 beta-lactamase family protein [Rhodothermales bacterium]